MSKKTTPNDQDDFKSVDSEASSVSITEKIQNAIVELPSLDLKVQAIAINHHIAIKRQLDDKMEKETYLIQHKHRNTYQFPLKEIQEIVQGDYEYKEEDLEFMIKECGGMFAGEEELAQIKNLESLNSLLQGKKSDAEAAAGKKLSSYWLKCLKNSDIVSEQIHPSDELVLQHLQKITSSRNETNTKISITFHFSENKWFNAPTLTKEIDIDEKGEPLRSFGDSVDWNEGMNFTIKKKKNKKKKKVKQVKEPSFFHFFESLDAKDDKDSDIDLGYQQQLQEDLSLQFELCEHLHDDLIPKSLEYFLGIHENMGCQGFGQCCQDPNCNEQCIQDQPDDQK